MTVKKNKVAPPFRVAEFDIMYNEGISKTGDIIDLGTDMDIVEKRGSFYSFDGLSWRRVGKTPRYSSKKTLTSPTALNSWYEKRQGSPSTVLNPAPLPKKNRRLTNFCNERSIAGVTGPASRVNLNEMKVVSKSAGYVVANN